MIELRWIERPESRGVEIFNQHVEWSITLVKVLQFRQQYNAFQGGYDPEKPIPFVAAWSEWQDVPTVREP